MKEIIIDNKKREIDFLTKIEEYAKKEKDIISGEIFRVEVNSLRKAISYLKLENQNLKMKLSEKRINDLKPLPKIERTRDINENKERTRESQNTTETQIKKTELKESLKNLKELSLPVLVNLSETDIPVYQQYKIIQQRKQVSAKQTIEKTKIIKQFLKDDETKNTPSSFGSLERNYVGYKYNPQNSNLVGKIKIDQTNTQDNPKKISVLLNQNQYQKIREIYCM